MSVKLIFAVRKGGSNAPIDLKRRMLTVRCPKTYDLFPFVLPATNRSFGVVYLVPVWFLGNPRSNSAWKV